VVADHKSFQLELQPAAVVDLEEIIDLDQRSFTMWSRQMFLGEPTLLRIVVHPFLSGK